MKKTILALLVTFVTITGFCAPHHRNHGYSHHKHHSHHRNTPMYIVSGVIHNIVRHHCVRVWVPAQTIIIGYDRCGFAVYKTIPGHYEYR